MSNTEPSERDRREAEAIAHASGCAGAAVDDLAENIARALAARDADLAALRRQIDALTASRKAYRNECAAFGMTIGAGCLDADAACRAAGVELEDRT